MRKMIVTLQQLQEILSEVYTAEGQLVDGAKYEYNSPCMPTIIYSEYDDTYFVRDTYAEYPLEDMLEELHECNVHLIEGDKKYQAPIRLWV